MRPLTILILSFLIICSSFATFAEENYHYLMVVKFSEKKLTFFEINGEEILQEINSYPVAIPKGSYYPLPLFGKIKRIELNPYWRPTEKTKIDYKKKKGINLPEVIKPGDPRNTLGAAKIIIQFENLEEPKPIHIHGTNEPESIGKKITRGCIRLKDEDILEITKIVQGKKVLVIFEN